MSAEEPIGFAPAGETYDATPRRVVLLDYAAATHGEVLSKVLRGAEREGWNGTAQERLVHLGWIIVPIYAEVP
jgi:hypothetical protein